jgi:Tfp pilus assembly protein PilF
MWDPGVMWGILAWGGLIGLATWSFRRDRRVTFCVGITALAFLPVSNLLIPIGTPVAERLFYLPSAGLCLLVGLGLSRLAAVQGHSEGPRRIAPLRRAGLLYTVFALVCLTLVGRTMIRNLDWSTEERFYRAMVRDTPRSAKAHAYLGAFLVNSDRPEGWNEALQEYRTAMELYPDYMAVSNDLNSRLGLLYLKLGRLDEAISTLRQATLLEPQKGWSWYLLARAYALHGNSGDAEDTFRMSLAMRDDPAVRTAFSEFLIRQSRLTEGLMEAERALRARPDFAPALYNRALALDRLQCHREAVSAYRAVPLQKLPPSVGEELRRRLRTLLSDPGRLSGSAHQPAPGNEACALKLIVTQSADHSGP